MSTEKLSPRQQMIGLMYLVLLAMLAMNASKDLLNAFVFLEKGINVTTENFNQGNLSVFNKIESAAALGSEKAKESLKIASQIQKKSKTLFALVENYKKEIIDLGGGLDENGIPLGKENQDIGAEYLLHQKNGEQLREKIIAYKKSLLALIDTRDKGLITSISELLKTPEYVDYEGNKSSWESGISEHLPLAAVTANLSNVQSYVSNAETQMINYLFEELGLDTYKVNRILAASMSENSYILQGDVYQSSIFLAAADTTQEPIILVGSYDTILYQKTGQLKFLGKVDSLPVKGGKGAYKILNQSVGNHQWGGIMKVPHPNPKRKGEFLTYPFKSSYTVAAPTAVISSEKLNIMYMGLENEINVSAPGIAADKLVVSANNGCSVRSKGIGKYEFTPSRFGKIDIQVAVKNGNSTKVIYTQKWTCKRLPKPLVALLNMELPPRIDKNKLKVPGQQFFSAIYSPDFPLTSKPKVITGKIEVKSSGNSYQEFTIDKGVFDPRVINSFKSGDKITIDLKILGADGLTHPISAKTTII